MLFNTALVLLPVGCSCHAIGLVFCNKRHHKESGIQPCWRASLALGNAPCPPAQRCPTVANRALLACPGVYMAHIWPAPPSVLHVWPMERAVTHPHQRAAVPPLRDGTPGTCTHPYVLANIVSVPPTAPPNTRTPNQPRPRVAQSNCRDDANYDAGSVANDDRRHDRRVARCSGYVRRASCVLPRDDAGGA